MTAAPLIATRHDALLSALEVMTEQQLADLLGVTTKTLANKRSERTGPAYIKTGGGVLYRLEAVRRWLAVEEVQTTAPPRPRAAGRRTAAASATPGGR